MTTLEAHAKAQEDSLSRYAAVIALLLKDGVELASNSRIRALAAAWAGKRFDLSEALLSQRAMFSLPEVVKALAILDSGRQLRVYERRLKEAKMNAERNGVKLRPKTVAKAKNLMDTTQVLRPPTSVGGTLSGALARRLRLWVRRFSAKELEYFALHFPPDPWRKLADLLHLNPDKDFPQLPWFLPFCFGTQEPPDGSYVASAKTMTAENVNELLESVEIPLSEVRQHAAKLTPASKQLLARRENELSRVIWWYEVLKCPEVDEVIRERLAAGEHISLNYGKLMERLLTFGGKPEGHDPPFIAPLMEMAEKRLHNTKLALDSPVLVIADASSSMSVAIKTATIIASLLSAFSYARLIFFNNSYWEAEKIPTSTQDVLDLARNTRASGCTAHAAGLWPIYEAKERVTTIFVVTDEEENTNYKNFRFLPLYKRYAEEVNPARLVFISFLGRQNAEGQMVSQMLKEGLKPMQFRMDSGCPDLTKLDSILGQLCAGAEDFEDRLLAMQKDIEDRGMKAVFDDLAAASNK